MKIMSCLKAGLPFKQVRRCRIFCFLFVVPWLRSKIQGGGGGGIRPPPAMALIEITHKAWPDLG